MGWKRLHTAVARVIEGNIQGLCDNQAVTRRLPKFDNISFLMAGTPMRTRRAYPLHHGEGIQSPDCTYEQNFNQGYRDLSKYSENHRQGNLLNTRDTWQQWYQQNMFPLSF